jgi:hypothetical protein
MWFGAGASWHYRILVEGFKNWDGTLKINSIGTDLVQSKFCVKLECIFYGRIENINSTTFNYGTYYCYDSNRILYIYSTLYSKFDTIANFNANIGDKWAVYEYSQHACNNSTPRPIATVQDTGQLIINNQALKYIVVSYKNGPTNYVDTIVEKIGGYNRFFFPLADNCVFDGRPYGPLICYSDNNFSYQKPGVTNCNYNTVDVPENKYSSRAIIYPCPANSFITVETGLNEETTLTLTDLYGRKVANVNITSAAKVDLTSLNAGVYLLGITAKGETVHRSKIIKQ